MGKGKSVNRIRTICEICREVNDIHQGDSDIDVQTRELLSEIVTKAKRMVRKLEEYKSGTKKELFTERTKNFKGKKKFRKQPGYKKLEKQEKYDD
jgi:hypothetical protein